MKKLLALVTSYLIAFSPVMARDIVAPRADEGIRFITKPGGTPTTAMEVDGAGNVKLDAILEKTAGNGVSVDGVLLKDGKLNPSYLGEDSFQFTSTGSLTPTSTSFVCQNMGTNPTEIRAVQKLDGIGWVSVDTIGTLVWVSSDGNKYLQGNIDDLVPSAAEPVYIFVR